jgi:toxin ParE1/3/4
MKIVFEPAALDDLDHIFRWIEKDRPRAASAMITRIEAKVARLAQPEFTYTGRPGLDAGTRELIEYPYIIVYEVHEDRSEIVVLAVFHGRQSREQGND